MTVLTVGLASSGTGFAVADDPGAAARGGGSLGGLTQQNTAQENKQNNSCSNPNGAFFPNLVGVTSAADTESSCATGDASFNMHTVDEEGGAEATGGSGDTVIQQNVAQQGRQNNNCANPNETFSVGGEIQQEARCVDVDRSRNKYTETKGGGARATGGSGELDLTQQNVAQEGRQNNNCANPNDSLATTGRTVRVEGWCTNMDSSRNKHNRTKTGGAEATGGSSGSFMSQQNVAQEGRQNNNCANPNLTSVIPTSGQVEARCKTVDHSKNKGTSEISHGAEAEGGSGALGVFQQNVAQEGRQNNNCGNPNFTAVSVSNPVPPNTEAQCVAVDRSKNIGTVHR
ncbi:hypothetical protein ABZ614_08790 [Streptomyces sp. NPDC013178]|uniref:hypothetical protein n=1 Tax=unclassified Streptomyces TaxID=2593676 RepID=UPI0033CF68A8